MKTVFSHSRRTRGVKSSGRARVDGKKAKLLQGLKVPDSNLACVPFVDSFHVCFSNSRPYEIIRAGDANS